MSLELHTTEELCDELLSRCKYGILHLSGIPHAGGLDDGEEWVLSRYSGNLTLCLGSTLEIQNFLHREQNKS